MWMRRLITLPVHRTEVDLGTHRVELLAAPDSPDTRSVAELHRVVLYVHGGGYIACSPGTHRPMAARIAREWNALTVVPDYRLAPEHAFPAGRDDVLATWRWVVNDLGVNPSHVVFAGDSAGGGLALAAALACRDAGLPMPGALVLFSPWADLTCSGDSLTQNAERCAMFVPAQLQAAAALYAGSMPLNDPGVSPLLADLSLLPPLCVHVSEDELLRDDSLRLAERAHAAGVMVSVRSWSSVPHVWQFLVGLLPEARESMDAAFDFVREHVPAHTLDALRARHVSHVHQRKHKHNETTVPHV
jgi:acetyl esterase/lipase